MGKQTTRLVIIPLVIVGSLFMACQGKRGGLKEVNLYPQYHGVTFVEKFKVWATGPDDVVPRDALYEADNYLFHDEKVSLVALKGESEAFQLVINADYGNVNNVGVDVSALRGPGAAVIPLENIRVYFEPYLETKSTSDYRRAAGDVTDPLPPLTDLFDLAKTEAQPVFVVVDVPADAAPGLYKGTVAVTAKDAQTQRLAVEVDVLPLALDKSLLPPAWIDIDYRAVASWYGDVDKPVPPKAVKTYLEFLRGYGVAALDGGYSQYRLTKSAGGAAKEWAKGLGVQAPTFFPLSAAADGTAPDGPALAEEYRALYGAAGEGAKEPVVWPAFPGGGPAPYAKGESAGQWWSDVAAAAAAWPGAPAVATAVSPFETAPGFAFPAGVRHYFAPFEDVALCPERFTALAGGRRYYLRADGSGGDTLDGRRAGARLLSWYGYLWNAAGVVSVSPPAGAVRPRHPWIDDPMAGTPNSYGNCLGQWFYPGQPVGAEGPVASVRLELLRQGLEDWVLFRMAEKKLGRPYVQERLNAVLPHDIRDLGDVTNNDLGNNQIHDLRTGLLRDLVGKGSGARAARLGGVVTDAGGKLLYGARVGDAAFATYTDEAGRYQLHFLQGNRGVEVTYSGFRAENVGGGAVKLYRGLKRLEPVFDFESGIDAGFWLSGDAGDALSVAEEKEMVYEGRIALAAVFPCGRTARVVNLYPRTRDFSKFHRFEFSVYNPNEFGVNLWLLLLDDNAAEPSQQFRRRVAVRPRGWTRVSLRTKELVNGGETRFVIKEDGTYNIRPAYRPDLTGVIGVGFESDGLVGQGGADNGGSYKIVIDDVKLIVFE